MSRIKAIHADSRDALRGMPDASIDACVTDPPYALVFMGKKWDTGETAFDPAFWAEVLRVLKPGAHLVAFGGTRTYHRLVCAIEDAGFEVRDQLAWLFGSGFPKSHDVSKGIDRQINSITFWDEVRSHLRAWRDRRGLTNPQINAALGLATNSGGMARHWTSDIGGQHSIPSKQQWQNLKALLNWPDCPLDVIYARVKDGEDRPVVGQYKATDPLAWYAEREPRDGVADITAPATDSARQWQGWGTALKPAHEPVVLARKPLESTVAGNVLKYGTGALNIDASRVEAESRPLIEADRRLPHNTYGPGLGGSKANGETQVGRWPANVIHDGSEEVLAAFPETQSGDFSQRGQSAGTEQPGGWKTGARDDKDFRGDSGSAARFFYTAKADKEDRLQSKHPTVKPVDLIAYLVRLITPPGGTVLDPFAGSGTTGMACMREGFACVLIEREAEYVEDIKRRLAHVRGEDAPLFAASAPVPQQLAMELGE